MANKFPYDIFLSHNHNDKPRIRLLAQRLKDAGVRVWFDDWNVHPGEIISIKVDEGLEQSRVLALFMSRDALISGWVKLERSTAVHRDPSNEDRRFIPVLLEECEVPDTLRRYKYIDFRQPNDESAFAELLTACKVPLEEQDEFEPLVPAIAEPTYQEEKSSDSIDLPGLKSVATLKGHESHLHIQSWSPNGQFLASSDTNYKARIWSTANWSLLHSLDDVFHCSWSPDSKKLLITHRERGTRIWTGNQPDRFFQVSGDPVLTAWSPDGKKIVLATTEGTAHLIDELTGSEEIVLSKHQSTIRSVVWSPDETQIATFSMDKTIRLWDATNGEFLFELVGHRNAINVGLWTYDGAFLISASQDQTIRVWSVESRKEFRVLEGHTRDVTGLSLSRDGRILASRSDDSIRFWRTDSWEPTGTLPMKTSGCLMTGIAFDARRDLLATPGAANNDVLIWEVNNQILLSTRIFSGATYRNAKVVLLGESTVGKTSLAHRLVEDKYVISDRTHGMNVWRLDLPLPADATIEREALLWDLAGQEDYRLIHQLFLEQTALALLLVNTQKVDPFAEAGDWLKALDTASRQAENTRVIPKLLIFSQTDVGGLKLSNAKIQRFTEDHGFVDWLPTSAKTGENCSDTQNYGEPSALKKLISYSIPWGELPGTSTPRLLRELKNAVVAMRDDREISLLRFAELTQRLEQSLPGEKFDEGDVRTAVTLLSNHGLARALKFGDLVLLQPELLNGYAAAIIRAARANTDEIGSVREADIYCHDFDFTGVERLEHRSDEQLLLHALVQTFLDHSLCIAEDLADGKHLVFPSQYRREKDIPHDPDIFVSYTFSGEWQTVWTTLVVRLWYSQQFQHKELWRNAAEFASPMGFTLGLKIDNRQGQGTATVSLYFDRRVIDELKVIFIEYVHRHLDKFGFEVSRDRRYVCKCGKPVTDLEEVRKKLEEGKQFIYCLRCDERVPLIDFIEQRLKSDPIARKVKAMDKTATRSLDTYALEQILFGHLMATCGETNQVFRRLENVGPGIDGEIEFRDDDGKLSGKKIYVQVKSWNYFSRAKQKDGTEIFALDSPGYFESWINQQADLYLVVRWTDEITKTQSIRWMNVSSYIANKRDRMNQHIVFEGDKLDMEAVWKLRDRFLPKMQS